MSNQRLAIQHVLEAGYRTPDIASGTGGWLATTSEIGEVVCQAVTEIADMRHAYTWFDDPTASYMVFGDVTRHGDKLAVGEDGFAATRTIRLYAVVASPPFADDAPAYRCSLENPPGDGFESVSWSPDGQSVAYEAGGAIYTVRVGDIAHGCDGLGMPRLLVAGATSPSWGPKGVPAHRAR